MVLYERKPLLENSNEFSDFDAKQKTKEVWLNQLLGCYVLSCQLSHPKKVICCDTSSESGASYYFEWTNCAGTVRGL